MEKYLIDAEKALCTAILSRAIADALKTDKMARKPEEAMAWLKSPEADWMTNGNASRAVQAIENNREEFRKQFMKAYKAYR